MERRYAFTNLLSFFRDTFSFINESRTPKQTSKAFNRCLQTLKRDHIHGEDHYKVINDCETALLDYLRGCEVFVAAQGRK